MLNEKQSNQSEPLSKAHHPFSAKKRPTQLISINSKSEQDESTSSYTHSGERIMQIHRLLNQI